jgi:hypothetical protein
MYELVTRQQHEQDMRRAAEFHEVQEARRRTAPMNVLARLVDRLTRGEKTVVERVPDRNPRTAA